MLSCPSALPQCQQGWHMGLIHSRGRGAALEKPSSSHNQGGGDGEGDLHAGVAAGDDEALALHSLGPRRKKRLRDVILHLQDMVERFKAQLTAETAKRDKALAHGVVLRAVYAITGCLEQLAAPGATPESDAAALAGIQAQTDAVLAAVLAAGGATSLGPRRRGRGRGHGRGRAPRVPIWSGINAPFVPVRPFLDRFLAMRGSAPDKAAFMARFGALADEAGGVVASYMAAFHAGGRHDEDPALDARVTELTLDMEGPLMGLLFFHGKTAMEVFTTRMDTGEAGGICPQEVWDEYAANLMPPTDGQDLFMEALHDWWGRETERLMERRRELGQHALACPEDHEVQHAVATQLDKANSGWVTRKVAGALLCHLSIYNAVQVMTTVTALRPHWATLTGVLEAMQRRRERLRAAALAQAQGLPAPGAGAAGLEVKEEQVSGGGEPRVKEEPRSDDSLAGNHDSAEGP